MAETLTNQTELEEEVEEVDKEIFEDPPGQSSGEKAAGALLLFYFTCMRYKDNNL